MILFLERRRIDMAHKGREHLLRLFLDLACEVTHFLVGRSVHLLERLGEGAPVDLGTEL